MPAVAWWPGVVAPGSISHEIVSLMDVFTTALTLAGVKVPSDRVIDGVDMTPVLKGMWRSLLLLAVAGCCSVSAVAADTLLLLPLTLCSCRSVVIGTACFWCLWWWLW